MLIKSYNRKKIGIIFFLIIIMSLTPITIFLFIKIHQKSDYEPEYYIQYLRTLSVPLTENIDEDLNKAIALMNFTHYYMTFMSVNLSKRIDVIALLENRGGLCSEYATLFTCLCVSIGINGRRTGLLLGDKGHQLTEICINGKWQVFDPLYNYYFNETTQEIIHNYNLTERIALFNTTYNSVKNKDNWSRNLYVQLADYFCCFYLIIENPGIFKPLYPERSQIYNDGQNPELPIFTDIDWYE